MTGTVRSGLKKQWEASAPLTATGLFMLAALVVSLAGLVADPRLVAGAPAWLKPAKFAASIAVYTLTLAWIFSLIPAWTRTRRIVGWTTAAALLLEIVIIDTQAIRGTTSHFNTSTRLDGALFTIMGAAILVQTLSTIAVAVALWRQRFDDAALGWALRLGVTITIAGALTGGLMTRPTRQQLDAARAGEPTIAVGAHTVGGPDGGPGLAGAGWSTEHGDLRVPHFVGLHAMQALPILALLLARRRLPDHVRVRLTMIAAVGYVALFGILAWQALQGQPLLAPQGSTAAMLVTWAVGTSAAAAAALMGRRGDVVFTFARPSRR
jgi:hypothetical protein